MCSRSATGSPPTASGRGIAGRVAGALTDVAFAVAGIEAVEIVHDRRNGPSGKIPARLGYRLVEEFRRPPEAPAESGLCHRWRLTAETWRTSLASAVRALLLITADAGPM